ncbi:MAG: flavoprotein [Methanobacteriota archaeon]|uniref:NADPH-dependent oxidoreductase n=1 Tax=Marine Group III euryarchaeote TaxID=2173149 RepID=A0A7J4GS93_9ARCH|nr:MAG: flavoprotein [Euryarchaeota archaeon]HIF37503.1 NADPH-dependent oxidoreductase [Marine Group III euryarchaeote]
MNYLIISTSLRLGSRSRVMAKYLESSLDNVEFFDLQDNLLPMCDGDKCYDLPEVLEFREKVKNADGIIMATPVYNFNVSSGAKNIVELGGKMLYDKIFGFMCAAGAKNGYMSVMSLANSLMIDFRCYIIPKFVYATKHDFDDGEITNTDIKKRIEELGKELIRVSKALN